MSQSNSNAIIYFGNQVIEVAKLTLMDDAVLRVALDQNPKMAKAILAPVLERDDFEIKFATTQVTAGTLRGHSVIFDCIILFDDGTYTDLELQKSMEEMPWERIFFNRAMLTAGFTLGKGKTGKEYKRLRHSIVVVLLDGDIFKRGQPLYRVSYRDADTGKDLEPGQGIYIANIRNKDASTKLGQLMRDITTCDPDQIKDPTLSESLKMVKSSRGVELMGTYYKDIGKKVEAELRKKLKEKYKAEGLAEGKAEGLAEGKAEGLAEGKAEGLAEGLIEGKAEGKKEMALAFYREGAISAETAAKQLNLSVEEFLKLAEAQSDN